MKSCWMLSSAIILVTYVSVYKARMNQSNHRHCKHMSNTLNPTSHLFVTPQCHSIGPSGLMHQGEPVGSDVQSIDRLIRCCRQNSCGSIRRIILCVTVICVMATCCESSLQAELVGCMWYHSCMVVQQL